MLGRMKWSRRDMLGRLNRGAAVGAALLMVLAVVIGLVAFNIGKSLAS